MRTSSLTRSHGAAELQYKLVHPRPWDVWLEQITTPNCHQERGMETIMDHNSTPPRETPATERPALVAKWKAQRTVRNNQVVESPRRLQCGVMLFRPWDIWILQALQLQKAVRRFNERRHSRSWSRSGVFAQSQFDQNATGDESEAGPPSSQQRFKPGGCTRHATLRRDDTVPGNSASNVNRAGDESEATLSSSQQGSKTNREDDHRVGDNRAAEAPRKSMGSMLFRPWDTWIQHAVQQKERRRKQHVCVAADSVLLSTEILRFRGLAKTAVHYYGRKISTNTKTRETAHFARASTTDCHSRDGWYIR